VLVRAERGRTWLPERKREIVAEMLAAICKPGEVAPRISIGQLHIRRREQFGMRRLMTNVAKYPPLPVPSSCHSLPRPLR
jgi:hypothetical protein